MDGLKHNYKVAYVFGTDDCYGIIGGNISNPVYFQTSRGAARLLTDRFRKKYDCSVHPKDLGVEDEEARLLDGRRRAILERSVRQTRSSKH